MKNSKEENQANIFIKMFISDYLTLIKSYLSKQNVYMEERKKSKNQNWDI